MTATTKAERAVLKADSDVLQAAMRWFALWMNRDPLWEGWPEERKLAAACHEKIKLVSAGLKSEAAKTKRRKARK